jgi:hypothetical protein
MVNMGQHGLISERERSKNHTLIKGCCFDRYGPGLPNNKKIVKILVKGWGGSV